MAKHLFNMRKRVKRKRLGSTVMLERGESRVAHAKKYLRKRRPDGTFKSFQQVSGVNDFYVIKYMEGKHKKFIVVSTLAAAELIAERLVKKGINVHIHKNKL